MANMKSVARDWISEYTNAAPRPVSPMPHSRILYLDGIRGLLAISTVLWTFFSIFVPGLVAAIEGPLYQKVLRIALGSWLWNKTLIRNAFFITSATSISIRFLSSPTANTYAGSILRRLIRLPMAVGVAIALACGISASHAFIHKIKELQLVIPNTSLQTSLAAQSETPLTVFNAVFDAFWITKNYNGQAANSVWPLHSISTVSLIYSQSWTTYFLMVPAPWTRYNSHWPLLAIFGAGSFWTGGWGWYNAAGLVFADHQIDTRLHAWFKEGMNLRGWKVPTAVFGGLGFVAGLAMKICWSAFPRLASKELSLHPHLTLSDSVEITDLAAEDFYARVDDFLVIFGVLILAASLPLVERALSLPCWTWLGRRSLSVYVASSLIFPTAGVSLFLALVDSGVGQVGALVCTFAIGTLAVLCCSEVYFWAVDLSSQWVAASIFDWLMAP